MPSYFLPIDHPPMRKFLIPVAAAAKLQLALLIPIVGLTLPKKLITSLFGFLFALTFFILPIVALLFYPNYAYFRYGILPVMFSGILLLVLSRLTHERFMSLLLGVGTFALGILLFNLMRKGLEIENYYTAKKFINLFGFVHPLTAGSACMAASFLSLFLAFKVRERRIHGLFGAALIMAVLLAVFFIYQVRSRNIILVTSTAIAAFTAFELLGFKPIFAKIIALVFCTIPLSFLVIGVLADDHLFAVLNGLSSGRMAFYLDTFQRVFNPVQPAYFFGPTYHEQFRFFLGGSLNFATEDSGFLSYISLFGFCSGLVFIGFLWFGFHWAIYSRAWGSFAVLTGVTIGFTFDAQGFTPSNLILFLMFAYGLRPALRLLPPRDCWQERRLPGM